MKIKGNTLTRATRKARKSAFRRRWIGCINPEQRKGVAPGALPSLVVRKQLRNKV